VGIVLFNGELIRKLSIDRFDELAVCKFEVKFILRIQKKELLRPMSEFVNKISKMMPNRGNYAKEK
jgi:hypothetical protein